MPAPYKNLGAKVAPSVEHLTIILSWRFLQWRQFVRDVLYKAFRDEQVVLVRDSTMKVDKTAELLEAVLRDAEAGRLELPRHLLVCLHAALERILSEE